MSLKQNPFKRPEFFAHFYEELESWAVAFSITTMNASIQFGPFWASVSWRGL